MFIGTQGQNVDDDATQSPSRLRFLPILTERCLSNMVDKYLNDNYTQIQMVQVQQY